MSATSLIPKDKIIKLYCGGTIVQQWKLTDGSWYYKVGDGILEFRSQGKSVVIRGTWTIEEV